MKISEKAKEFYLNGYNCCESILLALNEEKLLNIPSELLSSVSGFGAGIAGLGCLCGAISGAVLALGLKFKNKKILNKKIKIFIEKFKENYKSNCCRIITLKFKENFDSPERRVFCSEIVKNATEFLNKILSDKEQNEFLK